MPSRRTQVKMTPEEVDEFLHGRRTMNIATNGANGFPHVVAMWYGFVDGAPAFWTFRKSQKIVNLNRDPRITALVEDGDTYNELKGVELQGVVRMLTDPHEVLAVGISVYERYTGPMTEQARPFIEAQCTKRQACVIDVERVVSWDHTKLGGTY
jgi:PPOX class probable F420-dependent enzyme